jgi:arginase family enzyme
LVEGPEHGQRRNRRRSFDLCSITDWGEMEFASPYNLDDCIREIGDFYADLGERGITPLTIGGEHTITYGILSGLGRKEPVNVIHLDAHADVSLNFGGTRVSDASIFQVATCEGVIDSEKTVQIGMRGRGIMRSDFSAASGMRMFKMDEVAGSASLR